MTSTTPTSTPSPGDIEAYCFKGIPKTQTCQAVEMFIMALLIFIEIVMIAGITYIVTKKTTKRNERARQGNYYFLTKNLKNYKFNFLLEISMNQVRAEKLKPRELKDKISRIQQGLIK